MWVWLVGSELDLCQGGASWAALTPHSRLVSCHLTHFWKHLPFLILGRLNLSVFQRVLSDVISSRKTAGFPL